MHHQIINSQFKISPTLKKTTKYRFHEKKRGITTNKNIYHSAAIQILVDLTMKTKKIDAKNDFLCCHR